MLYFVHPTPADSNAPGTLEVLKKRGEAAFRQNDVVFAFETIESAQAFADRQYPLEENQTHVFYGVDLRKGYTTNPDDKKSQKHVRRINLNYEVEAVEVEEEDLDVEAEQHTIPAIEVRFKNLSIVHVCYKPQADAAALTGFAFPAVAPRQSRRRQGQQPEMTHDDDAASDISASSVGIEGMVITTEAAADDDQDQVDLYVEDLLEQGLIGSSAAHAVTTDRLRALNAQHGEVEKNDEDEDNESVHTVTPLTVVSNAAVDAGLQAQQLQPQPQPPQQTGFSRLNPILNTVRDFLNSRYGAPIAVGLGIWATGLGSVVAKILGVAAAPGVPALLSVAVGAAAVQAYRTAQARFASRAQPPAQEQPPVAQAGDPAQPAANDYGFGELRRNVVTQFNRAYASLPTLRAAAAPAPAPQPGQGADQQADLTRTNRSGSPT